MATLIDAGPGTAYFVGKGVPTQHPAAEIDHDLDITFRCDPAYAYFSGSGEKPFVDFSTTGTAGFTGSGTPIWGTIISDNAGIAYFSGDADLLLENLKSNFVKWSKIGKMDFTIDKSNVAGERPMDWKGWLYNVKKLGGKNVAYGSNGVTFLTPHGKAWGMQTVYRVGLKSKLAIAGTEEIHFFIDNKDQLISLADGLEKLDYSEYLSVLTDPALFFDVEANLLYICDGTYGFVYSPMDKSLGEGPVNITGISSQGGTLYVTAPAAITTPAFEICTDIHDLSTRKNKTVFELEFGTNLEGTLQAAIYYRRDFKGSFTSTPWYNVTERGSVFITAMGREFMFRAKALEYEYFEIDRIKINGIVHAH